MRTKGTDSISRRTLTKAACLLFCTTLALPLLAADDAQDPPRNLGDLTIEQLMNESVTSVSKKETKLSQSPAAIAVVSQEDIRRLGITSIPEALRIVPGLDVARVNANQWAISSRGFNLQYGNKLLVLMDGRTLYTPSFAGVFWNAQDTVMEDIDRIEVIRGPGATLWGANAVNGVINIITKRAKETQGTLISTSVGTEDLPSTTIRYGGMLATNVYYRAYLKYFNREGMVDSAGRDTPDDWSAVRGGFRLDWEPSTENTLTFQGDYYYDEAGENWKGVLLTPPYSQHTDFVDHNNGGNILGRWTRTYSETSQLTLQTYYDHSLHIGGDTRETRDTADIDLQHRFGLGPRDDIIWGLGYRYSADEVPPSADLIWTPASQGLNLYTAFIQDQIQLVEDRLSLILGSKFEHNDFTGFEVQPGGRLLWTPTERQTVWAGVSRAVRTPSRVESDIRINTATFSTSPTAPPTEVSLFGNPNLQSEELYAYELGYRIEPMQRLSFDIATFYNSYDKIINYVPDGVVFESDPAPPHTVLHSTAQNSQTGETYGAEISVQMKATDNWRLAADYTWLHMHLHPDSSAEGDSPRSQIGLRSYLDLPHHLELNGAISYVSRLSGSATSPEIPAYTRLDVGVVWRPTKTLELGIWGQNLLDNQHPEMNSLTTDLRTEIPRSVLGKITLRF